MIAEAVSQLLKVLMFSVINLTTGLFEFKHNDIVTVGNLVDLECSTSDIHILRLNERSDFAPFNNKQLVSIYKGLNEGQPPVNVTRGQLIDLIMEKINQTEERSVVSVNLECQCTFAENERRKQKVHIDYQYVPNAFAPKKKCL